MNLYQKLIDVRKSVPYLQKEADGPQYKYVGSSQVLANVRKKLDELNVLLTVKVVGHNVREKMSASKDKYGNDKETITYFTELDLEYTWIDADDPENSIVLPFYGQGVDIAGEKGVGKALTYAEKYFFLKQFNIATDKDDPDAFQQKHEQIEYITATQVGQIKLLWGQLGQDIKKIDAQSMKLFGRKLTELSTEQADEFYKKLESTKESA